MLNQICIKVFLIIRDTFTNPIRQIKWLFLIFQFNLCHYQPLILPLKLVNFPYHTILMSNFTSNLLNKRFFAEFAEHIDGLAEWYIILKLLPLNATCWTFNCKFSF